ncbi:hypothetical protein [Deinococcus sp.]|uniref:hypothetical protein n=1 Tax=Deinococcus sp. TaxID=47478 RepID=UPI0025C4621B|nr:hypothetical protein [Deinococcus sp.]
MNKLPLSTTVPTALRVTALLLAASLGSVASAQTGGILPLVSVGEKWPQEVETYTIRVSAADAGKPVALEIYSPTFNLADYADGRRGAGYFGDEQYNKKDAIQTTFTLMGPGGTVVSRKYGMNREHTWESLYAGGLPAGTYTLKVNTDGDGKNSFALRTAAPFVLETSDFTVNARDTEQNALLAARIHVTSDWVGKTVAILNYDIDGVKEAESWVILPGGKRVNLTTSDNGKTATDRFQVTSGMVGDWQVMIRVLPTTKQYSNAIRYSFRLNDKPTTAVVGGFTPPENIKIQNQLLVDVVDPQGRPISGATYGLVGDNSVRPILPQGWVPVSSSVIEGKGRVVSPTQIDYTPGYNKLRFVARPPSGQLAVDSVAIYGNQRIPLTGVPFQVNGQTLTTPTTIPLAPGDYPLQATPIPGSSFTAPQPGHVSDGATGKVTIEYNVMTEITLVTSPDLLNACDVTQLTATAKTDFPYKLPARLKINLPSGWTSDYPLELPGDFSAGNPLRLKAPVRVCRTDTADAVLDPIDLHTTGTARVRAPGGSNVSRNVQGGARATLSKDIQPSTQGKGYTVTLTLTVDSTLENVQIGDPLPTGGNTPAVRGPIQVQGPSLANVSPRIEGDRIVLGRVIPGTYTLTYNLFSDQPADRVVTAPDITW